MYNVYKVLLPPHTSQTFYPTLGGLIGTNKTVQLLEKTTPEASVELTRMACQDIDFLKSEYEQLICTDEQIASMFYRESGVGVGMLRGAGFLGFLALGFLFVWSRGFKVSSLLVFLVSCFF